MKVLVICVFSLILFSLISCQPKIRNEQELYSYIQNGKNGVLYSYSNENSKVSITYLPKRIISFNKDKNTDLNHRFFRLIYQKMGKDVLSTADQDSYYVLLNRLSFKMEDYLSVKSDGKEEKISSYQYFPTYGMTNNTEVVISIDERKISHGKEFIIKVKDIGLNCPDYEFTFTKNALDRLENLTTQLKRHD
ncbi:MULTISPECIES: hypothetical protein [unclassified Sphingobacterium]|uniref:hypothetical protein n=1 Tax=unclassified Sphingobacterium TaxID=2609468 RepID=UPI002954D9C1|nr:hypothetical protein [Sphingobacterium sp. UGAL515B_05]WON94263.1 hypothetical protein OK025_23835 [Sphingobacterium sp. UGAL515B_05]